MIGVSKTRAAFAAALMLAVAAPAPAQWAGQWGPVTPGKPVALTADALPPGLWKRTRKDDLSGSTKVVIPFFQVQFRTASKASSNRSFASLSQSYMLDGASTADMQAIADRLYDGFVADLTAQGLSVIPLETARAQSPALAKLLAAAKPAPFSGKTSEGKTSTIVTAHGTPIYFHTGDPQLGSMANIGSRAGWDQPAAAQELGATLIGVRIGMDFVEQQSSDKRGFMGFRSSTAKVSSQVGLSIEAVTTHMWLQSPKARPSIVGQPLEPVRYYLTSPLTLEGDAITDVSDTTTRGTKLGDVGATAVGMLLGGGGLSRTKTFAVTVDPAKFQTEIGAAMRTVEGAMATIAVADLKGTGAAASAP